jgi:hypothetical protein
MPENRSIISRAVECKEKTKSMKNQYQKPRTGVPRRRIVDTECGEVVRLI